MLKCSRTWIRLSGPSIYPVWVKSALLPRLTSCQGILKFSEMTHTMVRDHSGIWHQSCFQKQHSTLQLVASKILSDASCPPGWLSDWIVGTVGVISLSTGDIYWYLGTSPISAVLHKHFSGRWAALEIQMGISISQGMLSPSLARTSLSSQMFYLTLAMIDFWAHITLHLSSHMAFFQRETSCFLTTTISWKRTHWNVGLCLVSEEIPL